MLQRKKIRKPQKTFSFEKVGVAEI
jgi:hypothetical protein